MSANSELLDPSKREGPSMFGASTKTPIPEHKATGEIERVYHEIKPTLRVSGVNLIFRKWATFGDFLPLVWDTFRPNAESRAFETMADRLRTEAAGAATSLGVLNVASEAGLGASQEFQVRAALDLYHYVNPKLLVIASATRQLLEGRAIGGSPTDSQELIATGVPARMYAMEMESVKPDQESLRSIYRDIKRTLSLSSINSDYRTLALWPDYLAAAWKHLKPVVKSSPYHQAANRLREKARELSAELPYEMVLTRDAVENAGTNFQEVVDVTNSFERLLPGLILNIALLEADFRPGSALAESPFPAPTRRPLPGGV